MVRGAVGRVVSGLGKGATLELFTDEAPPGSVIALAIEATRCNGDLGAAGAAVYGIGAGAF
jgi:hypothetical protein